MRFKPTPLTETALVFSIAWLVCIVLALLSPNLTVSTAFSFVSYIAVYYLLASWAVWGAVGYAVRKKNHRARFFANITVTSVMAIAITLVFLNIQGVTAGGEAIVVWMGMLYFIGSVAGAVLTFFLLTRPKKQN